MVRRYSLGMTLKTRNRLILVSVLGSWIISFLTLAYIVRSFYEGQVTPPAYSYRQIWHLQNLSILKKDFYATIGGILFFAVAVPFFVTGIKIGFENTQSQELIYFFGFLLGCQMEVIRILVPTLDLWRTASTPLIVVGRALVGGRMMAPLCMMMSSLFTEANSRQSEWQNLLICLVISVMTAMMIPLDTGTTTSSFSVLCGSRTLIRGIKIGIFACTIIAMLINSAYRYSHQVKGMIWGFLVMMLGYSLLCIADCWVLTGVGGVCFSVGGVIYLKTLHRFYLWR